MRRFWCQYRPVVAYLGPVELVHDADSTSFSTVPPRGAEKQDEEEAATHAVAACALG